MIWLLTMYVSFLSATATISAEFASQKECEAMRVALAKEFDGHGFKVTKANCVVVGQEEMSE
jgi:hypothetical protein